MENKSLITSTSAPLPVISVSPEFDLRVQNALNTAALIGKVTNKDENTLAVRAQAELKACISILKKGRVDLKESYLEGGRAVDRFFAGKMVEPEAEEGRISGVCGEFAAAERARVLEEERIQQAELARIEREKQAELDRIAREQREREEAARRIQEEDARKAKEAAEAAAKLAAEATNKKQREAAATAAKEAEKLAEATRIEKERMDAVLKAESAKAAAAASKVEEKAGDQSYIAGRPVEVTREKGQRITTDWEIVSIDKFQLMRSRPNYVTEIKFDTRAIKSELATGAKIPGIEAKQVVNASVRAAKSPTAIDV